MTIPTTKERPPFPVSDFNGTCPECGVEGVILSVCLAEHVWSAAEVNEDGLLSFNGAYECGDQNIDPHIECDGCGAEWAEPEKVEYR